MTTENIRSQTRYLVFGDSTNTAYGDTELDLNVEQALYMASGWAIQANGDWQINGEQSTTDLVADQKEYIFPTDLLKANVIRVKQTSDHDLEIATKIDSRLIENIDDYKPATPEYDLIDNSLMLFLPNGIVNVTGGLQIDYQVDTTITLPEPLQRLSYFYAAYMYCLAHDLDKKTSRFEKLIGLDQPYTDTGLKKEIKEYYANRHTEANILEPEITNNY